MSASIRLEFVYNNPKKIDRFYQGIPQESDIRDLKTGELTKGKVLARASDKVKPYVRQ